MPQWRFAKYQGCLVVESIGKGPDDLPLPKGSGNQEHDNASSKMCATDSSDKVRGPSAEEVLPTCTLTRPLPQVKRYACNQCQRRFIYKFSLQRHLKNRHNLTPQEANMSPEQVFPRGKLRKNLSSPKLNACDQCPRRFIYKSSLERHLKTHDGQNPFSCSLCKRRFTCKRTFQRHMATHPMVKRGDRVFKCDICSKEFSALRGLREHGVAHTGERPYHCKICDRDFAWRNHYWRHTQSHVDQRLFTCDICKKTFLMKLYLDRHLKRHFDPTPFECKFCKKAYAHFASLHRHLKKEHTATDGGECEGMTTIPCKKESRPS